MHLQFKSTRDMAVMPHRAWIAVSFKSVSVVFDWLIGLSGIQSNFTTIGV